MQSLQTVLQQLINVKHHQQLLQIFLNQLGYFICMDALQVSYTLIASWHYLGSFQESFCFLGGEI